MIKVVLVDDHELVRSGLQQLLETDGNIQVIGEAGCGVDGVQVVRNLKPDVVVLDVNLPDISGLEVTHRLVSQNQSVKIMVVSAVSHDLFPFKLLDAGALSYLTKNATREELIQALKITYAGKSFICQTVANRLIFSQMGHRSYKKHFSDLSDREMEVMLMVIRGIEVKKIAKKLRLSSKTVHTYRSRIFQKLNVDSDMSLLLLAIKQGIVILDEMETSGPAGVLRLKPVL